MLAEHWLPRLDINPGDYEVIRSKSDPRKARVVHVLCRDEDGTVCVYEPVELLPDALPLKEAWVWHASLKVFAIAANTNNNTHNFLDTLK